MMMLERLSDLDELIIRCRTEEAREHIAEAVASYRGGAYRATIVMSWIAVVFDLIDKVRELSIAGEPAAQAILRTFEAFQEQIHSGTRQAMKQALEFERELLDRVCTDLSLIDAQQLIDLKRLHEDRHRCAHPSFNRVGGAFRPAAELARLHLRSAITHVLSQPPIQGKAALASLQALVASDYFPADLVKARTQLAGSALAHATPALVKNFVDKLIFGYVDGEDPLYERPQVLSALSVVADTHRGIAEPRIAQQFRKILLQANDDQLPVAVAFLGAWPAAWGLIEAANRERVLQFVEKADFSELEAAFPALIVIGDLVPALKAKLLTLMTKPLANLLQEVELRSFVADAAIARYIASGSYSTARLRRRQLISPILDSLTPEQLTALVTGASNNSEVYDETGFPTLFNRLSDLDVIPAGEFRILAATVGFEELLEDAEEEEDEA